MLANSSFLKQTVTNPIKDGFYTNRNSAEEEGATTKNCFSEGLKRIELVHKVFSSV